MVYAPSLPPRTVGIAGGDYNMVAFPTAAAMERRGEERGERLRRAAAVRNQGRGLGQNSERIVERVALVLPWMVSQGSGLTVQSHYVHRRRYKKGKRGVKK
jgi:hypothetical protein